MSAPDQVKESRWTRISLGPLFKPYWLVLLLVPASFAAWLLPESDFLFRGFDVREPLTAYAAAFIAGWYLSAFLGALTGHIVGQRIAPLRRFDTVPIDRYYTYVAALGIAGVVVSFGVIASRDPMVIVDAIRYRTFNEVRETLGYGAGIQSLRYAIVPAAAFALHRVISRRRASVLDVTVAIALLAASALASRLSLLLAIFLAIGLYLQLRPNARVSVLQIAVAVAIVFLLLTPLTYIRSANFYEARTGQSNPFAITLSEIAAYLAAPAQASVGVANHDRRARRGVREGGTTFARSQPQGLCGIPNGSFEASLAGWTVPAAKGNKVIRSREQARFGRFSAKLIFGQRALLAHYPLTFDYGQKIIQLWVYVPARFTGTGLRVVLLGLRRASGTTSAVVDLSRREAWQLVVLQFEPGQSSLSGAVRVELAKKPPRPGDFIYIDGLALDRRPPTVLESVGQYVAPTYFPVSFPAATAEETKYRCFVDVHGSYTANSTLVLMHGTLGFLGFALVPLVTFVAAAAVGHFRQYVSGLALVAYALMYCFVELWRTYLFTAGIVHFVVLTLLAVPFIDGLWRLAVERFGAWSLRRDEPH